jgi:general secretion pathway protein D
MKSGWGCVTLAVLLTLLASCSDVSTPTPASPSPAAKAPPPSPLETEIASTAAGHEPHPNGEIFPGDGALFGAQPANHRAETSVADDGGLTLNFVNADVKDVAKAVLGDYLKLNYEIGSGVEGTVTIQTSRPLPRSKVISVLDQTLRLNGMAIVYDNNIWKLVSLADAAHESGPVSVAGRRSKIPGYGTEIVPIKFISAEEMQKLLEPLAPSQAIVHVDATRNVLFIEGTQEERETLLADIALFDTNWLSGMSFALFTPNYMDAAELTKELAQILGGANSPIGGVVRLVPIERLNAVLAISPQTRYLEQLQAWVTRLDRPGQGSDKRIFVYSVQHGRASDLASTLAKALFGKGGSSNTQPRPTPQTIPEMQPTTGGAPGASGPNLSTPPSTSPAPSIAEATQFSGAMPGESQSALGPVTITADEPNNALVIVATPQQYASIESAMSRLDVTPLQVLLEAAIVEVTLTNNLSYGVQYYFQVGTQHQIVLSDSAATGSAIAPVYPNFSYVFTGNNIKVVLDALSSITKVEVLSSPELMVLNNQTASLQVGDQVPILSQQAVGVTTSQGSIVNSVQYENTGVILQVTPRVNRSGEVMMDISQEVSDVSSTTTSDIDSPTIEQRKITSTVAVQDGETVALGGLISKSRTESKTGIPFLQEIPVLGNAFRDTQDNDTKTELLVLITPHVVDSIQRARSVTDELRRRLPLVEPLLAKRH